MLAGYSKKRSDYTLTGYFILALDRIVIVVGKKQRKPGRQEAPVDSENAQNRPVLKTAACFWQYFACGSLTSAVIRGRL